MLFRSADQALKQAEDWGCSPTGLNRVVKFKHIFSHVEWHMTGYYITCSQCGSGNSGGTEVFRWVSEEELEREVPLPSAFQYFL